MDCHGDMRRYPVKDFTICGPKTYVKWSRMSADQMSARWGFVYFYLNWVPVVLRRTMKLILTATTQGRFSDVP